MISTIQSFLVELDLSKSKDRKFGFSIRSQEEGCGHYISKIDANGLGKMVGLKVGDRITQINNKDAINMTHYNFIKKFKDSTNPVLIQINRGIPLPEDDKNCPNDCQEERNENFQHNEEQENSSHAEEPEEPEISIQEESIEENLSNSNSLLKNLNESEVFAQKEMQQVQPEQNPECVQEALNEVNELQLKVDKLEQESAEIHNSETVESEPSEILSEPTMKELNQECEDIPTLHKARLCQMMRKTGENYGFRLAQSTYNNKFIHIIPSVKDNSIAFNSNMRDKDIVIEINGINVENMDHTDTVNLVKNDPNQVNVLVVEKISYDYFNENNVKITTDAILAEIPKTQESTPLGSMLRLCTIQVKEGTSFGFTIQWEDEKHMIINVKKNCAARNAGVLENDIIAEVNSKNVFKLMHDDVVDLVKSVPNYVQLLLIAESDYEHFKSQMSELSSNMEGIKHCSNTIKQLNIPPEENIDKSAGFFPESIIQIKNKMERKERKNLSFNMEYPKMVDFLSNL